MVRMEDCGNCIYWMDGGKHVSYCTTMRHIKAFNSLARDCLVLIHILLIEFIVHDDKKETRLFRSRWFCCLETSCFVYVFL